MRKDEAARSLESGLVARPNAAELEQKGILKSPEKQQQGDSKEKKLTLNMLFQKKQKTPVAAPKEVVLSEAELDALVLQLADEKSGPVWAKGKKLLTVSGDV